MGKRRFAIRMAPHEKRLLEELQLAQRIPIDQYEVRREALASLTSEFNEETGRSDSCEEILHFMRTKRKNGEWPKLGENFVRRPEPAKLTAEEIEKLMEIYDEGVASRGFGSDSIAYDEGFLKFIEREFSERTGRHVPGAVLNARITALRKRALTPKVVVVDDDAGFDDIDIIAG